jgi:hypothetical protein
MRIGSNASPGAGQRGQKGSRVIYIAVDDTGGKLIAYGTGVTPALALSDAKERSSESDLSVVVLTDDEWEEWKEHNDA